MKKIFFCVILATVASGLAQDRYGGMKHKETSKFSNAEDNFKIAMQKILEKYIDKSLTRDELYRAATEGMLTSLNAKDQKWNELLSPEELKEIQIELSGKIVGIGAEMEFDDKTGYARILRVIPNSPAEKAGILLHDQILSVDGKKFRGKKFQDLVGSIRGSAGKGVELKILREDKIVPVEIVRQKISWSPVQLQSLNESTAILTIGYFTEETPQIVAELLAKINKDKISKLILDLRDNSGGGFEQAVKTAELFLPLNTLIVSTKTRDGKNESYLSKNSVLNPAVQVVLLTNKQTKSGGELFTAALKENKKLKIVGEPTFGKWNAQIIDVLPNNYALKFTVKDFFSPQGRTFQGEGLQPDLEISLAKDINLEELRMKQDIKKRVAADAQLKAAVEILKVF